MSEVVSIRTREPWQPNSTASKVVQTRTKTLFERILGSYNAVKNDKLRKTTPISQMKSSYRLKEAMCAVDTSVMREMYNQISSLEYASISFGTISDDVLPNDIKLKSQLERSKGLIHPCDDPDLSVVWEIDQETKEISLSLAYEFFEKFSA